MSTEIGLSDEPIDRGRGVEILHRHLKAEILGSLIADRFDDRVGHADVAKFDVLDFLRPNRGKSADGASSCSPAQQRTTSLKQRAA